MQTQKVHIEINNIHHIMSNYLGNLFLGFLERRKYQIIGFFSGTKLSGDNHRVNFTTSDTSLHLTVDYSCLKNVLKI